jgi:hypothetical protein
MKDWIKKSPGPLSASLVAVLLVVFAVAFETQSSAQTSFRFVSWGDAQDEGATLPATSDQAVTANPAFTIFNGDAETDGFRAVDMNLFVDAVDGDSSGQTSNGMYNKTFLVRGNGDNHYANPGDWQNYLVQANRPPVPGVTNYTGMDANSTYLNYAFDYENARFIGLDAPGTVGQLSTAQIAWVDEILTPRRRAIIPSWCMLSFSFTRQFTALAPIVPARRPTIRGVFPPTQRV